MSRWLLVAAVVLAPTAAHAANGLRPRTPAIFGDVPCMMTIEVGQLAQFDYSVAMDDTELTPEELPDSRTMQFFALAAVPFNFTPPRYISQADLDRAEANGDNTMPYGAEDVLESASAWPAGSFIPITAADPRVPITTAQAAMGVQWDTTGVAPGGWVVAAYTWEPENNLWSFRSGALRLVEPGAPDAAPPSAFVESASDDPTAMTGAPYPVSACIAAPPGSTYTASYGILDGTGAVEPTWVPFVDGEPVTDDVVDLMPVFPTEAANFNVKIRLDVTDPDGRSYVAYSQFQTLVLPGEGGGTGDETSGGGSGTDDGGKTCAVGGHDAAPVWAFALLALAAALRRRP